MDGPTERSENMSSVDEKPELRIAWTSEDESHLLTDAVEGATGRKVSSIFITDDPSKRTANWNRYDHDFRPGITTMPGALPRVGLVFVSDEGVAGFGIVANIPLRHLGRVVVIYAGDQMEPDRKAAYQRYGVLHFARRRDIRHYICDHFLI